MWVFYGLSALLFGIGFASCEVYGTYEFLMVDQNGFSYIVAAGTGIALAVSLLPAWAAFAWRRNWFLSTVIWVLFAAALGTVVTSGLARTGTATDRAEEARQSHDKRIIAAATERADAERGLDAANDALDKARADITEQAPLKTCRTNCAALLQAALINAQNNVAAAEARLSAARGAAISVPVAEEDSLARRLVAILPWRVSEDAVRLYQPIVVPALASLLSAVLMAFGLRVLDRRSGRGDSDKPPTPLPHVAGKPASVEVPSKIAAKSEPSAQLQLLPPTSAPLDFIDIKIAPDPASEVHMREVCKAYDAFCAKVAKEPMELHSFVREFAKLCRGKGFDIRLDGKDAFLVGGRLVA